MKRYKVNFNSAVQETKKFFDNINPNIMPKVPVRVDGKGGYEVKSVENDVGIMTVTIVATKTN